MMWLWGEGRGCSW